MFECDICGEECYDLEDMDDHLNDYNHWQDTCPKEFRSWHAACQHMNSMNHWRPKVLCEVCNAMFRTQDAVDKHMAAKGHYKNYCQECRRHFNNENNLKIHLNSRIHRGSSLACPFCNNGYTTASGVAHHLETGSCSRAPKMNRETIHRMIRERDQNGFFTVQQLEWHESDSSEFSASSYAFNGDDWECYLCHRGFRALCIKDFTSLAGLFNHLESETCGFTRFERVQQQVHGIFRGGNLLAF
ncbi:hypothetical protein P168DRAFT_296299 [Aspergillus campestris IBT 28561]|uniref:C2H2-type domain-containing protein n=1 Tax=Aspergillus campestris (strain IBT 28561) TaxID=1392248 RepID=A0A2I1D809_ASPC2|nr:uncharacterized protein P168DRAFT_296299 [Aspergillus campestris IBT 28561]PKY06020.1 hypothetical protein P168DRAFT_296299 [Aspergillus campestris IBT 28561]